MFPHRSQQINSNTAFSSQGFTLIELITVMVVLSVVVALGAGITVTFIKGQRFVDEQANLLVDSQLTVERMAKELRAALPFSYRVSNGGRCLVFLPVTATGFYLDELPHNGNSLPPTGRSSAIAVSPYTLTGDARYLAIAPAVATELYGNNAAALRPLASYSATELVLFNDHRWLRASPQQRFYITSNANAFCLVESELRYYSSISPGAININLSLPFSLLANNASPAGTAYVTDANTTGCESCVQISLLLSKGSSQINTVNTVVSRYRP